MMSLFLSQRTYAIGKVQGLRKIGEAEDAFEPRNAVHLRRRPLRNLWSQLLDIRLSYSRRIATAGGALFIS